MRFAIFKGEQSIGELVARIFRVSSTNPVQQRQAADSLLTANPHLKSMSNVPPGARIIVPESPLAVNPGEMISAAGPFAFSTIPVGKQLDVLKAEVLAAAAASIAKAQKTLALVHRSEVQAAAANDQVLADRLTKIEAQAKTAIQNAQNAQAQFGNANQLANQARSGS
jgi:hypothetical protein